MSVYNVERRLRTLAAHVAGGESNTGENNALVRSSDCKALVEAVDEICPNELYEFLVRHHLSLRAQAFEFFKDDIYKPNHYLSLLEFRELTLQRLKKFVEQRFFSVFDYTRDPLKFIAALETLSFVDYSLAIKAGVHFTLCGGTIAKLGTQKHHTSVLPLIDNLTLPGCFGMTELGHGSNVMGIETTAVYDQHSGEFVINTPSDMASKYWIGGSGQHGKVCTVFAQLHVRGEWQGPHVFVVRIRDDNGALMPGVRIVDHGPKMGLNGVDNGRIWFDNVRVARDDMLDALASVDANGTYSSKIASVTQRFGATVGGLTTGRILIAQGAIDASKIGTTIAISYACQRTQWNDKPIIQYITHQRRLFPGLATTYALQLAMLRLKELVVSGASPKTIHVMSSGLKAAATWSRVQILQNCRECCGGFGVLSANKIGPMKNDMDVDVTFEGDNTVMMQQVAKGLLDSEAEGAGSGSASAARPPSVDLSSGPILAEIAELMSYRERSLVAEVSGAMRAAAEKGGASGAAAAFEDNLDTVVIIGWAHMERTCFNNFVDQVGRAPFRSRPALQLLCTLYGMSLVERSIDFYLASGALTAADRVLVRDAVNRLCAQLADQRGRLAMQLCKGFGIPDHLLAAPIAFDYTKIAT